MIQSTANDRIQINKDSLSEIQTCLQNAHDKIDFLQLESLLQQEEIQQSSHDSELVFVPNNPIFESKVDCNQQLEII